MKPEELMDVAWDKKKLRKEITRLRAESEAKDRMIEDGKKRTGNLLRGLKNTDWISKSREFLTSMGWIHKSYTYYMDKPKEVGG